MDSTEDLNKEYLVKLEEMKTVEELFKQVEEANNETQLKINICREELITLQEKYKQLNNLANYYENKCKDVIADIYELSWSVTKAKIFLESDKEYVSCYNLDKEAENSKLSLDMKENVLLRKEEILGNEISDHEATIKELNKKIISKKKHE